MAYVKNQNQRQKASQKPKCIYKKCIYENGQVNCGTHVINRDWARTHKKHDND